jgi:hypothetical protein
MKQSLSFWSAVDSLERRPDTRMTKTIGKHGAEFYVVPDGGRVRPADARKIIQRPGIAVADPGLFCDTPQSWRYLRHA